LSSIAGNKFDVEETGMERGKHRTRRRRRRRMRRRRRRLKKKRVENVKNRKRGRKGEKRKSWKMRLVAKNPKRRKRMHWNTKM
jgi:hypothetical protein